MYIKTLKLFAILVMLQGCASVQYSVVDQTFSDFKYVPELSGDVWQTPEQTLANGGDCEDFVVLLRYRLLKAGVAPEEIELIQGWHLVYGSHMVLRYRGVFIDNFGSHKFYPEFKIERIYSHNFLDRRVASHRFLSPDS